MRKSLKIIDWVFHTCLPSFYLTLHDITILDELSQVLHIIWYSNSGGLEIRPHSDVQGEHGSVMYKLSSCQGAKLSNFSDPDLSCE